MIDGNGFVPAYRSVGIGMFAAVSNGQFASVPELSFKSTGGMMARTFLVSNAKGDGVAVYSFKSMGPVMQITSAAGFDATLVAALANV